MSEKKKKEKWRKTRDDSNVRIFKTCIDEVPFYAACVIESRGYMDEKALQDASVHDSLLNRKSK